MIQSLTRMAVCFLILSLSFGSLQTLSAQSGIFETYVVLNINGGGNIYYDMQAATGNPDFQGANLGTFGVGSTLVFAGGENKTYKCFPCDITNGTILYRVWTGTPSGSFTAINLPWNANLGSGCGGNDQKWASTSNMTNILTGLPSGSYTLEVYASANYQGCGTGTHYSNNGGSNYTATFTVNCPTYYADTDGDGFGDSGMSVNTCTPSPGYVADNTDCDDGNSSINPGATEVCNGLDDDCNTLTDDGLTFTTYYADTDNDTYGDALNTVSTCDGAPEGYVSDDNDCDDTEETVYPGATEICDGLDNNCNEIIDEGTVEAIVTPADNITVCKNDFVTFTANTGIGYTYQWYKNGNIIPSATADSYNANKPGYYQVMVTVPGSCSAISDATLLNITSNPSANISAPNGTSLCATVKLKASYNAAYTWQWKLNGFDIGGANSALYFPSVAGSYTCTITNENDCSRTSNAIVVTDCKEINAYQVETQFNIYPNPAFREFTIVLQIPSDQQNGIISIVNLLGEEVYVTSVEISNNSLETKIILNDDLASGLYLVKIAAGNTEYKKQIIISK